MKPGYGDYGDDYKNEIYQKLKGWGIDHPVSARVVIISVLAGLFVYFSSYLYLYWQEVNAEYIRIDIEKKKMALESRRVELDKCLRILEVEDMRYPAECWTLLFGESDDSGQ